LVIRSRRFVLVLLWLVVVAAPRPAEAQALRVTPVTRDEQVLVSFELADAYTSEVRDAIQSGLQTTFTYDVELRRSAALWFDRLVASARVSASVKFDNLTRRYQVTIAEDGRVSTTTVTDDEEAVRKAVATFQRLPLFRTRVLEANGEYYIRVRARLRPRSHWSILPWDREGALGSASFTFIPR
jgi:hypothetical protein